MGSKGRFGKYGGQYVPETLMNALIELEEAYRKAAHDPAFERNSPRTSPNMRDAPLRSRSVRTCPGTSALRSISNGRISFTAARTSLTIRSGRRFSQNGWERDG